MKSHKSSTLSPFVDAAVEKAGIGVEAARTHVGPALSTAIATAGPAAEAARERAAHGLEVALDKATPVAESARDRAVDDALPRLADALAAFSAAAISARDSAVERAADAADARGVTVPGLKKKSKRRGRFATVALFALAGAALAGVAAYLRNRRDPWSDAAPPATSVPGAYAPSSGAVTTGAVPLPTDVPVAPIDETGILDDLDAPGGSKP